MRLKILYGCAFVKLGCTSFEGSYMDEMSWMSIYTTMAYGLHFLLLNAIIAASDQILIKVQGPPLSIRRRRTWRNIVSYPL
jgi:hypothetical protein